MVKAIIKEISIIILLCIAIILVLGIVFYDYVPITKVIPTKISYTVPENIKNELDKEDKIENKTEETVMQTTVYEITTSDLKKYENLGIYNKGKPNPFAMSVQHNTNNESNNITIDNNDTNSNKNTGYLFDTVGK